MLPRFFSVLALAALAACSTAQNPPSLADRQPIEADDDPYARARAAGLTSAQADALLALGAPVLLPRAMPGWTVDRFDIDDEIPGVVGYGVRWRRGDGACVEVFASNDGLGGPEYPIVSAEVALAELPGAPRYRVYKASDDPASSSAENWGAGTVISDFVELGGDDGFLAVWLSSADADGCRPVSLQDGAALLASLRPLDPASPGASGLIDMGAFGLFAPDEFVLADPPTGPDPVSAVEAYVEEMQAVEPLAQEVSIESLGEAGGREHVLLTLDGLYDDSARERRVVFVFSREGAGWTLTDAGWQQRCWPNRGHQDLRPEPCL